MPRLIHGDAITQNGNKYVTDFIVLRQCDTNVMVTKFAPLVDDIADYFKKLFNEQEDNISKMNFYGSDFTMKRLGYIALPAVLQRKITKIKDNLKMANGVFPPRKDGRYGWFIVTGQSDDPNILMGSG